MTTPPLEFAEKLKKALISAIKKAATTVPKEVFNAIQLQVDQETNPGKKAMLEVMLENISLAESLSAPACQDTGVPIFFVQIGGEFPSGLDIMGIIRDATVSATNEIPLRPNAINPLNNKNSGNNIGYHFPPVYCELGGLSDQIRVDILLKGGGAENYCRLFMLTPATAWNDLKKRVIEAVFEAGGRACPPLVVGIGIGGDATTAMYMAKKVLLRAFKGRNSNPELKALEEELLEKINQQNIGPMGLGGSPTALEVCIEMAHRHPASFPVGIVLNCYLHRLAYVIMDSKGDIEIGQ